MFSSMIRSSRTLTLSATIRSSNGRYSSRTRSNGMPLSASRGMPSARLVEWSEPSLALRGRGYRTRLPASGCHEDAPPGADLTPSCLGGHRRPVGGRIRRAPERAALQGRRASGWARAGGEPGQAQMAAAPSRAANAGAGRRGVSARHRVRRHGFAAASRPSAPHPSCPNRAGAHRRVCRACRYREVAFESFARSIGASQGMPSLPQRRASSADTAARLGRQPSCRSRSGRRIPDSAGKGGRLLPDIAAIPARPATP